jgi:hypothetical protein
MRPHYSKRSLSRMLLIGLVVFSALMVTDYLIFGYHHTTQMIPGAIGAGLAFALLVRFGFF